MVRVERVAEGPRTEVAESAIRSLRMKLLDLSARNRLLNFKHSDRARGHIRVIDELPDVLMEKLLAGRNLRFCALPEPEDEPKDEDADVFLMALEQARETDEIYRAEIVEIADNDPNSRDARHIERALKDRVREALGLPKRRSTEVMSRAEFARSHGLEPEYEMPKPEEGERAARHDDDEIQTLLFPDELERKVSGLAAQARTNLQETGVNTLYYAFGFLEWYESEDSDRLLLAPLLLHPLEIERVLERSRYNHVIRDIGDETETNVTLSERLAQDFSLRLPAYVEDDTPEAYLAKIEALIAGRRRWRVRRYLTVGHFAFARITMYQDLDPGRWPKDMALHTHPAFAELFGGTDESRPWAAPQYDTDDPELRREVPLLVTDADSSQYSALVDIMRGRNLAIEGPPGTGKSQTITNAIAVAMAAGKSVLFIAEKMAALEVVKSRLDSFGLGPFVLELHSTKARKMDVLKTLRERLAMQYALEHPAQLVRVENEIEDLRQRLRAYVEALNAPAGEQGMTVHDILWKLQRARDASPGPDGVAHISIANASNPNHVDQQRLRCQRLAAHVSEFAANYGSWRDHPWSGIHRVGLSPFDREQIIEMVATWRVALDGLIATLDKLPLSRQEHAATTTQLQDLLSALGRLPEPHGASASELVAALADNDAFSAVHRLSEDLRARQRALVALLTWVDEPQMLEGQSANAQELAGLCEALGLADRRVAEFSAISQAAREEAERWDRIVRASQKLARVMDTEISLTLETARPFVRAAEVSAITDHATFAARSENILAEDATKPLAEGKQHRDELCHRLELLQRRYHVPLGEVDKMGELRAHAEALEALPTTPVLSVFATLRPSRRKAMLRFRSMCRKRRSVGRCEVAAELRAIANIVEEIDEFCHDRCLRAIAGDTFAGIDTDFESLIAVNELGREVRQSVTGPEPSVGQARDVLLHGPLETLEKLRAVTRDQEFHELRDTIDSEALVSESNLEQVAAAHARKVGEIERCQVLCGELRLKPDVSLSSVVQVAEWNRDLDAARARINLNAAAAAALGNYFAGPETDLENLAQAVMAVSAIRGSGVPAPLAVHLLSPDYRERLSRLRSTAGDLRAQLAVLNARQRAALDHGMEFSEFLGGAPEKLQFEAVRTRLERCLDEAGSLSGWTDFCKEIETAKREGLSPIIALFEENNVDFAGLDAAFDRAVFETLAREAYRDRPELAEFRGRRQEEARRRFQELDRRWLELERDRLRADLTKRDVDDGVGFGPKRDWTGRRLIEHELSKKRKHISIRDLLARAGHTIQQMKPCFMMSPFSVAQFLKPEGLMFDLVVIDEASQMKPEYALGALARATQVVVVGDPNQLPPTSFFDRLEASDQEDDEAEATDVESILDLAMRAWRPYRRLLWHYRSRHHSLIAFSNKWFYDNELIVFPSPCERGPNFGVSQEFVTDRRYKGHMNVPEARAIAEAAIGFMHSNPERSLGLVAMNQAQSDLIRDEVWRLIARDEAAASYVERWEQEDRGLYPFFVKNLENVQGDERDVIYISTTYGPDGDSAPVMQRFGPINTATGHRRLNVLFTRAREQVRVFTSLRPSDIQIDGERVARGRTALRGYLEYALTGRLEAGETHPPRETESPFEEYVKAALERCGYEAVPQVGVAGYFIDLGVRDAAHPDSFLCGLECDGATYHSVKSVRDRDRLRQEILESLGWKIYRIWSTDWFENPRGEMRKLEQYLQNLREHASVRSDQAV